MLNRVFVCPKCRATCLFEDWNERKGKCKYCTRNKFNARKVEVDKLLFDSRHESNVWQELCREEKAGIIRDLERQVVYVIEVNGMRVCKCILDFRYIRDGHTEVADAKSKATMTPVYRLKKKLMKAIHNIDIIEV